VRRRALLGAGFALTTTSVLGLTSCDLRVGSPQEKPSSSPPPSPSSSTDDQSDDQALVRALTQAEALAAGYARAVAVRSDLVTPLGRLAADHAAHVQVLHQLVGPSSASATPPGGAVPPITALTATSVLSQFERAAATQAEADLVAVGGQPARLLASLAACRSAHVAVLARLPQAPAPSTTKSS
jgi:hypothetical protein